MTPSALCRLLAGPRWDNPGSPGRTYIGSMDDWDIWAPDPKPANFDSIAKTTWLWVKGPDNIKHTKESPP